MRCLITGLNGQLGHDLAQELKGRGWQVIGSGSKESYSGLPDLCGIDYARMDIRDKGAAEALIRAYRPDAVAHCAAWTAVDAAQQQPEQAEAVNIQGTENIAAACRELGCKLLYISTDYVFNGSGERPWQPSDEPDPINVYGRTKLAGEQLCRSLVEKLFIIRTSWVFGSNGKNFIRTMLGLRDREALQVVDDQIGRPTYTRDLARLAADMLKTESYGLYHASNTGPYISWKQLAEAVFQRTGGGPEVKGISTERYAAPAPRPHNSRLDHAALEQAGFLPLPPWQEALDRYLKEIGVYSGDGKDNSYTGPDRGSVYN